MKMCSIISSLLVGLTAISGVSSIPAEASVSDTNITAKSPKCHFKDGTVHWGVSETY